MVNLNDAAFDFPAFSGIPKFYLISSTPRSGSTLLTRSLWDMKIAGAPKEYFNITHIRDFKARWQVKSDLEYLDLTVKYRTSPNGWYGVKSHWPMFEEYRERLKDNRYDLFNKSKYVWIYRHSKEHQAVSWARARQTKQWAHDQPEKAKPKYDPALIETCFTNIKQQEVSWQNYFDQQQIQPFMMSYRDLVLDRVATLSGLLNYLEIPHDPSIIQPSSLKKQSDHINEDWLTRFFGLKETQEF